MSSTKVMCMRHVHATYNLAQRKTTAIMRKTRMLITTLETVVALAVVGGVTEGQVSSRIIKNLKNHY